LTSKIAPTALTIILAPLINSFHDSDEAKLVNQDSPFRSVVISSPEFTSPQPIAKNSYHAVDSNAAITGSPLL
jgi:hypothetical protein